MLLQGMAAVWQLRITGSDQQELNWNKQGLIFGIRT
jgi:hypothetical protein